MNFLDRGDEKWLEAMLDSRQRVKRIKQLSELRPLMFWCSVMAFIAALVASIASSVSAIPKGGSVFLIGLVVPFWCYSGMDQELRLLKLVGRLPVENVPRTEPPTSDAN